MQPETTIVVKSGDREGGVLVGDVGDVNVVALVDVAGDVLRRRCERCKPESNRS
jgi:hypothetical protein